MYKLIFLLLIFGNSSVNSLSPFDFHNYLLSEDNVILLDVRNYEDYNKGYIENALWAGNRDALDSLLINYDKNQPVLLYCSYGYRTKTVIKILKKKGFKQIIELNGGIDLWINQGFPICNE